jgi:hypothetical protein
VEQIDGGYMDLVEFEFAQMGKSAHRGVKKNQSVGTD